MHEAQQKIYGCHQGTLCSLASQVSHWLEASLHIGKAFTRLVGPEAPFVYKNLVVRSDDKGEKLHLDSAGYHV